MIPLPARPAALAALALALGSSPWLATVSAQSSDPFAAGERWSWMPAPTTPWVPSSIALSADGQFVWSAPAFGSPRLALHAADELASGAPLLADASLGSLAVPPAVACGADAGDLFAVLQSPLAGGLRETRVTAYDAFAARAGGAASPGSFVPSWTHVAPFPSDAPAYLGAARDGSLVVWAGWDTNAGTNRIEWLDAPSGASVTTFAAGASRVRTFASSADGARVALTAGTELFVVSRTGGVELQASFAVATNALALSGDGGTVLVGDQGGTRRLDEGTSGWSTTSFVAAGSNEVATRLALSDDGSVQAIAWWNAFTGQAVRVEWTDVVAGTALTSFAQSGTTGSVQNFPAAIALTPDGRRAALALWGAGDARPEVVLLDASDGLVLSQDLGQGSALAVALSDDGTRVASATKDVHANSFGSFGAVRLFDTGERDLQALGAPLVGQPLDLAAQSDGASIVFFLVGQPATTPTVYPFSSGLSGTLHLERSSGLRVIPRPADATGRADLALPLPGVPPGAGTAFGIQALFRGGGASWLSSAWVVPTFL